MKLELTSNLRVSVHPLVKVMKHSTLYGFNIDPHRSKGYEEKLATREAVDTLVKQGGLKRVIGMEMTSFSLFYAWH